MGKEDFTTYTESDPNNKLSQTADRSTFINLLRTDADTYLWTNKAGQLQNFIYYFKLRITGINSSYKTMRVNPFWVSSALDDFQGNRINDKSQFGLNIRSLNSTTVFYWYIYETAGANDYTSTQSRNYNKNTDYYVKIEKAGTSLTVSFYSDPGFKTLIESKNYTLHNNWDFPYLMVPQGLKMATATGISGYVENLTDTLIPPEKPRNLALLVGPLFVGTLLFILGTKGKV